MKYLTANFRADVVSPEMKIGKDGLTSTTYAQLDRYHYGSNLIVFNPRENLTARLTSEEVAHRYFQLHDPAFNGEWWPARLTPTIYPFKKNGSVKGDCSEGSGAR